MSADIMSTNLEQPVLDEIARLVDWQMEEGLRRGDGPDPIDEDEDAEATPEEMDRAAAAFMKMTEVFPQLLDGLAEAIGHLVTDTLPRLRSNLSTLRAAAETEGLERPPGA